MKDEKQCIAARSVLWYLVFTGFAVNYMIRTNLNISIVSMIKTRPRNNESLTSECIVAASTTNSSLAYQRVNFTLDAVKIDENSSAFEWNEYQQALILGAFFWLHWTTQIPGGLLANKYGTKLVFGLSNFSGVLFCFVIPAAAYMGHKYLILVRVVQGLVAGFCWPAMHTMTARWIPPNERSKFVTAYLGSSVGAALTFPMCGFIIDTWGWEVVFYVTGALGTLWYAFWYFLAFDSPAEHPRISQSEREYIVSSLGQNVSKEKAAVPWKALLTSIPVWTNVFAQWGGIWGLFTIMTHGPTYFKMIHGWNIKATGFLSGIPHVARMLFAYLFSLFGDYLLSSNKMSRTNVRKLATAFCCIVQGFCMIALAFSDCNYTMAIVFATAATGVHGSVSTGPLANLVDISPNYASILLGIGNGMGVFGGFISPIIVGYLTYNNQTVAQWSKVFWIAAAMLLSSGSFYLVFANSEVQWWNSPNKQKDADVGSELSTLQKGNEGDARPPVTEQDEKSEKLLGVKIDEKENI